MALSVRLIQGRQTPDTLVHAQSSYAKKGEKQLLMDYSWATLSGTTNGLSPLFTAPRSRVFLQRGHPEGHPLKIRSSD